VGTADITIQYFVSQDRACFLWLQVGCSNWKRVFLILAGVVDPKSKQRPSVDIFRQVNSLMNYSPKEQEHRLR
jgi:hypothetical protein